MKKRLSLCLLSFILISSVSAKNKYVKIGGDDTKNGNNWANAYATVTQALSTATTSGDNIYVAKGTYYPTSSTDRSASFSLNAGVNMYGGFLGTKNNPDPDSDRTDFEEGGANQTILSGDIGTTGDNSDNSYQVVNGSTMWTVANFDGFVVTDGNGATGTSNTDGVGIKVVGTGPFNIKNCTFKDCVNGANGAGMYFGDGTFTLNNTYIKNCNAEEAGGVYLSNGGGVLTINNSRIESNASTGNAGGIFLGATTTLNGSQINNNTATNLGGGLYIPSSSTTTIRNSLISNNSSANGGGMYISGGLADINNNMIVNNDASTNGAGIYFTSWGSVTLANNTIANNNANSGFGGGIYSINYSGIYSLNNIFYGNSLAQISLGNSNNGLKIGYCYVDGGEGGIDDGGNAFTYVGGSFTANCVSGTVDFVNPTSSLGLDPTAPSYDAANWALDDGSVCIDAGTPTSATGTTYPCFYNNGGNYEVLYDATYIAYLPFSCPNGLSRINGIIDMGAFEKGGIITSDKKLSSSNSNAFVSQQAIYVTTQNGGKVTVYNLAGKRMFTKNINKGTASVYTPSSAGIYVVSLQNTNEFYSTKVSVR